jgi:hypothetical protein
MVIRVRDCQQANSHDSSGKEIHAKRHIVILGRFLEVYKLLHYATKVHITDNCFWLL